MTLVLGARCGNGVVIIADRKITDLVTRSLVKYDEKINGVLRNIIFAYEGAENMFNVFLRYVAGDVVILRDADEKYTSQNLIEKLRHTMIVMRNVRDEQHRDFILSVMVGRQFPFDGRSDLNIIRSTGKSESVKEWIAIGSGEIISSEFINAKWNPNMSMKDFAELGYCTIKYIEEKKLDERVGVGIDRPSIKFLDDGKDLDRDATDKEYEEFQSNCHCYFKDFSQLLNEKRTGY